MKKQAVDCCCGDPSGPAAARKAFQSTDWQLIDRLCGMDAPDAKYLFSV